MKKTFIFGHRKPDTDSVTSAIVLSYLKNQLGFNTVPRVLGDINNESKFVLDYFKIDVPEFLSDVKLQIKDLNYTKDCFLNISDSIFDSYTLMSDKSISNIPIIDNDGFFAGTVSLKDVARELITGDIDKINSSYNNISFTLKADEILKFDNEIKGNLLSATYQSKTFIDKISLNSNTILIVGDRHTIIKHALNQKIKMLILTGGNLLNEEELELAKKNKINVLVTQNTSFVTSKLVGLTNYIMDLAKTKNIICLNENDSVNEFLEIANKQKFSNYPVIDNNGKCLGVLKINDVYNGEKKKVILVDHNELEQSVSGLDEAEIVEIIDHHKIGTIGTTAPINFRNMPVGCTNTILFIMYQENKIKIPREMAGLMLSGIISDTLLFRSPTTTEKDKEVCKELANIAGVNLEDYGMKMLKAGSSIKGKTKEEILFGDFKNFTVDNKKIGIGQVSTMNSSEFIKEKDDFIKLINKECEINDYYMIALFITDILENGSYIFFNDKSQNIFENAFEVKKLKQADFFKDVMSRKKQIVPNILSALERS